MLKVENVSTGYGKRQVLFDVSFEVGKGEIVLLIGSNGSGKSTLLKYVYGLQPKFKDGSGKVVFDGEDITGIESSKLIRKGLVYIPQKNNVFDNLNVKDNLEMSGITLGDKKIFKQRYEKVLELFPLLKDLQKRMPMKLSGGERQMLAFAMATLHEPKMILADEPFAGLSPRNIELIKLQLLTINRELDTTFLVIEHKIKESYSLANKITCFKLGKVVKTIEYSKNFNINDLNSVFI